MEPLSRSAAFALGVLTLTTSIAFPFSSAQAAVSDWERSVSFIPQSPTDLAGSGYQEMVRRFKGLGFNSVTIIIPLYQDYIWTTTISPAQNAPTDEALRSAINYAHSQGMRVMLKPHLDPAGHGEWRALINPPDRETWFNNYRTYLLHYAKIAQETNVELLCIGTELVSMTSQNINPDNTVKWKSMIGAVRSVYSGKLLYGANHGGSEFAHEVPQIGFWNELDYIGISAYFPLPGDGSIASLKSNWQRVENDIVGNFYSTYKKPIIFSEVGYRSVTNAHEQPWDWEWPGSYDPQEQVRDYTALIEYWRDKPYFKGFSVWNAIADPARGGEGDLDFLIQGKPVEQTIKQLFMTVPPPPPPPPPATTTVTTTGLVSPVNLSVGQSTTLNAYVTPKIAITGAIVDLEVYNTRQQKVFQYVYSNRDLAAGQTRRFGVGWRPTTKGLYVLKIGVFSGDWSKLYTWNNGAAIIQVF